MKIDCSRDATILINSAIRSHSDHWTRINNTEEYLMEYKKPVDEETIKRDKTSWRNNWNYGRGRMLVEQGVISNVLDMVKTIAMMEITFAEFDEKKHKNPVFQFLINRRFRYLFSNIICDAFADTLERDPRFHDFITLIEYCSYTFGYGPVIRDKFTYLGKPVFLTEIAFEDRTELTQIYTWVTFDCIKGEALLQKWDTIKKLTLQSKEIVGDDCETYHIYSNGWVEEGMFEIFRRILENNEEIKTDVKDGRIILSSQELDEEKNIRITTWQDVETIRTYKGDVWMSVNVNNIFIAKLFTTDCDNNITETHIVSSNGQIDCEENENGSYYVGITSNKYLLYQKNHGEKGYTSLLNIIKEFGVRSKRYIQDLKGVSRQVVEESVRYDMKRNSIEDKMQIQGSLILSKTDELEDPTLQVFGSHVILPPGVNMAANQIRLDLNDHIASLQSDDVDFKQRISHYNPQLQLSNRPTKDEVQFRGTQHNFQRQSKIPSKLKDYSILFFNILKDLINESFENPLDKESKSFFYDAITRIFKQDFDIDKKDVDKILKQIRCITLHPVNTETQAIQTAMPFAQNSEGKMRLIKCFLLSLGFSRTDVNLFVTVADYGQQIEQAALENAAFYNTSEIVFDESQDHIGHLDIHFPKIDRKIKGIQAGEDIVAGFNYITNALTNTAKHVGALSNSPFFKNRFKQYLEYQNAFEKTAKQLSEMIKQKREENQQNQSQDMNIPPEQLKKIQLMEWQAQKKNERTNWLTQQAAQRKMAEFQQKLEMKQADHETDLSIKKDLAEMQKELEQMKSAIKLANE